MCLFLFGPLLTDTVTYHRHSCSNWVPLVCGLYQRVHSPLLCSQARSTAASVAETLASQSKSVSSSLCAVLTQLVVHCCQDRASSSCWIVHALSKIQDSISIATTASDFGLQRSTWKQKYKHSICSVCQPGILKQYASTVCFNRELVQSMCCVCFHN